MSLGNESFIVEMVEVVGQCGVFRRKESEKELEETGQGQQNTEWTLQEEQRFQSSL